MIKKESNKKTLRLIVKKADKHITLYLYQTMLQEFIYRGKSPDTIVIIAPHMRGYGFGYFDDVDTILRYDRIKKDEIDVMRRIDGGGCIFHDYGMGGYFALGLSSKIYGNLNELIDALLGVSEEVLLRLGINSKDITKVHGDLRWREKKIGSISVRSDTTSMGEEIFSGLSIPVFNRSYPDMEINEKYAIIPKEKMKDKKNHDIKKYFAVLNDILQKETTLDELTEVMKKALIDRMAARGIKVYEEKDFTPIENEYIHNIIKNRNNEEWICRISSKKFFKKAIDKRWMYGYSHMKFNKLVKCFVALSEKERLIKDIYVGGDIYISPNTVMDNIRESILGLNSEDKDNILKNVDNELVKENVRIAEAHYISSEQFAMVIFKAIEDAELNHRKVNYGNNPDKEYEKRMAKFV